MEEKLVFKNKGYRKMCIAAIFISAAISVAYIVFSIINLKYYANYPRFYCRAALLALYTVELCLFANRSSIYLEIGGDFALARRSAAFMLVFIAFSAIVEAYYVSIYLSYFGRMRLIYMCVIIGIGALSAIGLLQFEYLNLDIVTMRICGIVAIGASLVSFCIGFFVIGLRTLRINLAIGNSSVISLFTGALDSFAPVFLVNILSSILLMYMSHILFVKEMKFSNRLNTPAAPGEKDENLEDF